MATDHSKVAMSTIVIHECHGNECHGTSRLVKVVERTPCAASGKWKNIWLDFQWINSGAMASEMQAPVAAEASEFLDTSYT